MSIGEDDFLELQTISEISREALVVLNTRGTFRVIDICQNLDEIFYILSSEIKLAKKHNENGLI